MSKLDIVGFLRHTDLFRDLDDKEIDRIARQTHEQSAKRGAILFNAGDTPSGVHFVVRGQIKLVFTSARGDEKVAEVIGPGRSFGEAVVFAGKPYPVRSQALRESLILLVDKQILFEEMSNDNKFAARVIASLSRRVHALMGDLEANSMHSGAQRFIGYLLREFDDPTPDAPVQVHLDVTKNIVASRLNLSQEHLSRILHDLMERELIEVRGRDIVVPSIEQLRQFGE